jgi:hypothetical protein
MVNIVPDNCIVILLQGTYNQSYLYEYTNGFPSPCRIVRRQIFDCTLNTKIVIFVNLTTQVAIISRFKSVYTSSNFQIQFSTAKREFIAQYILYFSRASIFVINNCPSWLQACKSNNKKTRDNYDSVVRICIVKWTLESDGGSFTSDFTYVIKFTYNYLCFWTSQP